MLVVTFERFNDEAKAAVTSAHAAAERVRAADTESGHLLLGIVTIESAAVTVLVDLGVSPAGVEAGLVGRDTLEGLDTMDPTRLAHCDQRDPELS